MKRINCCYKAQYFELQILFCITALPGWNLHFEIHRLILGLSPYVTGNFKGLFTNEVTPKASMSSNKVFSDIWQLVECRDDKELSCKCRLKKSPSLVPYLTYPLTSRQWKCSSLLQKMISCVSPYISVNCRTTLNLSMPVTKSCVVCNA